MQADLQFISRLKNGEHNAFEELYDQYAAALYSSIVRLIPDPSQRETLLHEVFRVIRLRIHEYDPARQRLFTWLYKIVIECIDEWHEK